MIPILGKFAKWGINKAFKKIPPKDVTESFLKDEMAYDIKMAERIYGSDAENVQQIIRRKF